MIDWINFSVLIISLFLFSYFYILSVQPVKREKRRGERAWRECMRFRVFASVFEFIIVINLIMWLWFPIPLFNWKIHIDFIFGLIIGILISIPCVVLLIQGMRDAGSETLQPSKQTQMYGGIYNYIRHPQSLGEFPLFIAIAFIVNSWFLVALTGVYILLYIPIMIYYEEKDLIKRFGEKYREYQKRTGVLFPRFKRKVN
ncbi:MAG: methyltransferase family protein [Candidatus Hermodarchaeota archaeon]